VLRVCFSEASGSPSLGRPIVGGGGSTLALQKGYSMAFLPGLRFRKSVGVLPGVKVNLSKTGVSTSVGGHGATMNIGTRGRTVTLGIPGTGLSYRTPLNGTIVFAVLVLAAVVGIAFLMQPELVRLALHAWQPRWF
jgi:hypothetical protein